MRAIILFIWFFMAGCTTLPRTFNTENIMRVHQGMSSQEVLDLFGEPKSVRQAVCGAAAGKPWTCTTWSYGAVSQDRATFTFSGDGPDSLVLNDFRIDRK